MLGQVLHTRQEQGRMLAELSAGLTDVRASLIAVKSARRCAGSSGGSVMPRRRRITSRICAAFSRTCVCASASPCETSPARASGAAAASSRDGAGSFPTSRYRSVRRYSQPTRLAGTVGRGTSRAQRSGQAARATESRAALNRPIAFRPLVIATTACANSSASEIGGQGEGRMRAAVANRNKPTHITKLPQLLPKLPQSPPI